ncbi:hypothetical protein IGI04_005372 [Brassica rapa subsp. trilocularis]|uniref:HTH myb-type domain-containing protein n=1 Tax=Brassica rapa subsp. trilocularis TaxID=1813537 RepID=A0ABQ7NDS5_BRACM|nr:hypothetical protein IGI04_005372 [Brassica rapa subsp. trilocularis]
MEQTRSGQWVHKTRNMSQEGGQNGCSGAEGPAQVNRTGTSGQDRNENTCGRGLIVKQQDNASEKGSSSQRTCSGRVRPRLPSPVPLNISPLKSADSFVRRRKKFWTPEEVEALREGVKEYGKSWKDIKNANPAVFAKRTEVEI